MYVNTRHRQVQCLMAMDTSGLLTLINLGFASLRQTSVHVSRTADRQHRRDLDFDFDSDFDFDRS